MIASSIYYQKLLSEVQYLLDRITISSANGALSVQYIDSLTGKTLPLTGSAGEIREKLSDAVYQYFKRPTAVGRPVNEIYLEKLREKYRSDAETSRFRSGWAVEESDFDGLGSILIKKDNYYSKQVLSGAYLIDEYPIRESMPVQARWHLTSNNDLMGQGNVVSSYYEVSGTTLPNDYQMTDVLVRFYFNIDVNAPSFDSHFLDFFGRVAEELNRRFVPFQFKAIYQTESMGRADTAVLYIDKRYFFLTIGFILSLSKDFAGLFGKETPMFTYELAPGIGFAEQPPFDKSDNLHFDEIPSFGQHRSAIIASGIIDWHLTNDQDQAFNPRDAVALLKYLSGKPMSAGVTVFATPNNPRRPGPLSAFFLNRKSDDYPYVASYFDSGAFPSLLTSNLTPAWTVLPSDLASRRLYAATLVGYKLCSEAIWDSYNRCSWLTFSIQEHYVTINNGLADGLAGIVTFLHQLYQETGDSTIELHLHGAAKCLSYKLRDKIDWITQKCDKELVEARRLSHGYYHGDLPGLIVLKQTNMDLSGVLNLSTRSVISRLKPFDPVLTSIYVSDGVAGTILALCEMAVVFGDTCAITKAEELSQALIGQLFDFSDDSMTLKVQELGIGFNFGVSGVAFALLKLGSLVCNDRSRLEMAARNLLEYERTQKTGPFWNFPQGGLQSDVSYLGMIDMAASRVGLARYLSEDKLIRRELNDAIEFINTQISDNVFRIFDDRMFNFGIADLTLELNPLELSGRIWDQLISRITKAVSDDDIQFNAATSNKGFTPGMLSGYAGLGYFLLKMSKPAVYKSFVVPA